MLDEYISFQEEIITRRTRYDLQKAKERAHLLEGLLIAQDNIDEVIRIIRQSYDDAKERLMARFGLDDVQDPGYLGYAPQGSSGPGPGEAPGGVRRASGAHCLFERLLSDEIMLRGVLKDELTEIRDKYGDQRRTESALPRMTWTLRT